MQITSLGYQTDLALLTLGGSQIEDKGDHVAIRTPDNPSYWWGNFLLLPGPPPRSDTQRWMEAFAAEFPEAKHLTLGFDGDHGTLDDIAGFAEAGLTTETAAVMTAREVHPPPRPNTDAVYRALKSDADWAQRVDLRIACKDDGHDADSYRIFAQAQSDTMRALADAGHGDWFGAFVDGQMMSSMGLYRASPGLARFQSVETHPDARGRGLAGTLVHYVSQYGFAELDAHTLVMVADPTYLAIRVYRSVGFAETEAQLQAERPIAAQNALAT